MPLPNLHNKKNIIKLNNSISFFATKEVPFHITAFWVTLWPRWEMGETVQLNFIASDIDIWSPANHSRSGTSSCTVQQNERENWRAFLQPPQTTKLSANNKKHGSLLEYREPFMKNEFSQRSRNTWLFFGVLWLFMSTQPHGLRKPIEGLSKRNLKWLVLMREPNKLTSAISKNLDLGCNFEHYSANHFLH